MTVLQRRKLAKKNKREKKKTNLEGHARAAASLRGTGTRGEMKAKKEGVGHGREGARQNSGKGGTGGWACLAVCLLGDAVCTGARGTGTRCMQPQGVRQHGTLAAKEEVSKKKRKRKENEKTYLPVPMLGVGVLTGW